MNEYDDKRNEAQRAQSAAAATMFLPQMQTMGIPGLPNAPFDQSQQQGYMIPLPSFEQRVEMAVARIESRLAADDRHAAARIEDLKQQLAEQNAYIQKLETCIKELGSSLPERGA